MLPPRPLSEPDIAVMTLTTLTCADVAAACERLQALIGAAGADLVVCDVGELVADLMAVEVLARLRLTARRLGCGLRLRRPSRALEQIVAFCGLCDVLPVEAALYGGGNVGRNGGQAEQREHPRRVEERVDGRDLPA